MIYTAEEKRKIENVLAAFNGYIRFHPDFDIVYSPKVGYFMVPAIDYVAMECVTPFRNRDELLDALFNEICNDVRSLELAGSHEQAYIYPVEIEESRRRIEFILNAMKEDKDYCLARLASYIEHVSG